MNLSKLFLSTMLAVMLVLPHMAHAASKPTCALTVSSPRGSITIKKEEDILARLGERLTFTWKSDHASRAFNDEDDRVALQGSTTIVALKTETYSYRFTSGSKKVECSVKVHVVDVAFDTTSLTTNETKPTLSGEASGTKTVRIQLRSSEGKKVYTSKDVRTKKGAWDVKIGKTLTPGSYAVTLYGEKNLELNTIATTTLTILSKGTMSSGGTISVSQLPLLTGGAAAPGASLPVAYIQVRNTGTALITIEGFRLTETGSSPDEVVIGFTTNDDKGGSRSTIGGAEGTRQFKNGSVLIPLPAVLGPGQFKIFTIKAITSATNRIAGTQLKIDIAGVVTSAAKINAVFPIRGTTWVLR